MSFSYFEGIVKQGKKLARTLGFPTLNLHLCDNKIDCGVYTCIINLDNQSYQGVMNLGYKPTFKNQTLILEVHVFDFNQNCYGKKIQVTPISFIRSEQKFTSIEKLKEQIQQDVEQAKNFFKHSS